MEFQVHNFDSLPSTNLWLKENAALGLVGPGTVVQADFQTEGRGRLGRVWESKPEDGLLFSVLLQPNLPETLLPLIGFLLSLAVLDGLEKHLGESYNLQLRWPNDILYSGKKLVGILCESQRSNDNKLYVVAGVGINLNQSADDFSGEYRTPPISLRQITGKHVPPMKLLPVFLKHLDELLERLRRSGWGWITQEWIERASITGRVVEVSDGASRLSGIVRQMQYDGALSLEVGDGKIRTIRSGELL